MTKKIARLCALVSTLAIGGCYEQEDLVAFVESKGWKNIRLSEVKFPDSVGCEEYESMTRGYQISGINPRGQNDLTVMCCYFDIPHTCSIKY